MARKFKKGRKQNEECRQREKEKGDQWLQDLRRKVMNCSCWLLTSEILSNVTNGVWLSMQRGFNLNMRATNSLVTAGLRPIREWIRSDLGQFKCPECHCRGDEVSVKGRLVGDNDIPKQRWCKGSKSGFLCKCVCVCLFFWSRSGQRGEQHRKSMAWPSLGASQTLSTDTTVSVGNRLVGAREDYLNCGYSQSSPNKHIAVSNQAPSRVNAMNPLCNTTWMQDQAESLKS